VADDGNEFYGVYQIPDNPHPWVKDNVLPLLDFGLEARDANKEAFMQRLAVWLWDYRGATVIADWPADIEHMCNLLSFAGMRQGFAVPIELTFKLIKRANEYESLIEHNALSDARALRDYCNDWKI